MTDASTKSTDDSLDPVNWESFRQTAHRVVDRMIDHLSTLRDQPAWQAMPTSIRESFKIPLPVDGMGDDAALEEFFRRVLPYSNGNQHPRFWGFVQGTGLPIASLADFMASMMNAHLAGFDQAPTLVEEEVIRWLAELLGFPSTTRGLLTSGGTMAGLMALATARYAHAGFDIRRQGLAPAIHPAMRIYASNQTHHWLIKAVEVLGLGRESIHWIDVDENYQIHVDQVEQAIEQDRANGEHPLIIIGNAGTVQTGAIDPLDSLADVARRQHVWLHVDGAFGALARLSSKLAPQLQGIQRADSVAFDLHKWLYIPFESACLLVREGHLQTDAFVWKTPYLANAERGVAAGGTPLADRGIELTRSFKALKVWLTLLSLGTKRLASAIETNVAQAQALARQIDEHPQLERMAPAPLNVVCFRFIVPGQQDEWIDRVNEEILYRIQESGWAIPSSTRINKRYVLRVAIVNHRTQSTDLVQLVDTVVRHGQQIANSWILAGGLPS